MTIVDTAERTDAHAARDSCLEDRANRLSAAFSRMVRSTHRMRSELTSAQFDGRELATLVVLDRLAEQGPLRAGTLAERLHMDPSQVSRTVAALVREQAVQRQADPDDGRATLLVLTPAGRDMAHRFARAKSAHVGSVIADWDPGDADAFTAALERFVDGVERLVPARIGPLQPIPTPPAHTPAVQTSAVQTPAAQAPPARPGPDGDDAPDTTPAEPGAIT